MKAIQLRAWAFLGMALAVLSSPSPTHAYLSQPKLVLLMVIDQFRADYLIRYEDRFLPAVQKNGELGGFRALIARSAYYPAAQHDLIQNITAPGHATLSTGSYPYQAGIPMNDWFNPARKGKEYCVQDDGSPIVSGGKPFPLTSIMGMSPKNLTGSTLADELKNLHPTSRVVSLSLKDRAAVLMGGHRADLALWFDPVLNQWVSSRFYRPDGSLPKWAMEKNQEILAQQEKGNYSKTIKAIDDIPPEQGVDMTVFAAEAALKAEHLGQGKTPDFLAVSFSSHDITGHEFGPNSPQIVATTLLEDRAISRLLNRLNREIPGGLKNVLIALSADHGVSPSPEWAVQNRLPAGRIADKDWVDQMNQHLTARFGKATASGLPWVTGGYTLNYYLNQEEIRRRELNPREVENEARNALRNEPEIAWVVTKTDVQERRLPPGVFERQILRSHVRGRSGDLLVLLKPFYLTGKNTAKSGSSQHLSGYAYDRTVPLLLAGPHIRPGIYSQRAEIVDLAPTFSFLLGTLPPSQAEGRILTEALQH